MTTPEQRLLETIFAERYGPWYERALARAGRRLMLYSDRRCGIPLNSNDMPTGLWAKVNTLGVWLTIAHSKSQQIRWYGLRSLRRKRKL